MMSHLVFCPAFPQLGGQANYMYSRCVATPDRVEVVAPNAPGCPAFDTRQEFRVHRFGYLNERWPMPLDPAKRAVQTMQAVLALRRVWDPARFSALEVGTVFPASWHASSCRASGTLN